MDLTKKFGWDNLPGTGLSSKDYEKALFIEEHPHLAYNYDDGIAIHHYLQGLKAGKLIGRTCEGCGRTLIPPRMFCELCYRATDEWVEVKDTGVVQTFAICNVNWDASRIPDDQPRHLPAVIAIDGAGDKNGLMHLLGEVKPKDIHIGMHVQAVWKPEKERTGAITDIRYWKPIKTSKKKEA